MRLARIGIENVAGYATADSALADTAEAACLPQMSVHELHARLQDDWQVIDVRRPAEYKAGHVPGAVFAPLTDLPSNADAVASLSRTRRTAIICGSGYRSSAASHFLREAGFEDLHNVTGGTSAWISAELDVER